MRASALLLVSALAAGCATRSGPQPTGAWPLESQPHVSISVAIKGTVTSNGAPGTIPGVFPQWREQALAAYRDSGCFSTVSEGLAPSDLQATIEIRDDETHNKGGLVLGSATLFLIPVLVDSKMIVNTEWRDRDGRLLGEFSESEVRHLWIAILLLPAFPFAPPASVMREMIYDLNRRTIATAASRGLLDARFLPSGATEGGTTAP